MTTSLPSTRLLALCGVLLLAACGGGKTMVESDLGIKGAPDWINKGTATLNDHDGRLIHGIGQAPTLGDVSLQTSTADQRARAEVARVLSTYIDAVATDYSAATQQANNQQAISREITGTTHVVLSGTKIIAHWRDKKSGEIYALAELDMKQVQDTLKQAQNLNQELRNYVGQHGDTIFDRLTTEKKL